MTYWVMMRNLHEHSLLDLRMEKLMLLTMARQDLDLLMTPRWQPIVKFGERVYLHLLLHLLTDMSQLPLIKVWEFLQFHGYGRRWA